MASSLSGVFHTAALIIEDGAIRETTDTFNQNDELRVRQAPLSRLKSCRLIDKRVDISTNTGSPAFGAFIGAEVAGPLGAAVGASAMSGGSTTSRTTYFVELTFDDSTTATIAASSDEFAVLDAAARSYVPASGNGPAVTAGEMSWQQKDRARLMYWVIPVVAMMFMAMMFRGAPGMMSVLADSAGPVATTSAPSGGSFSSFAARTLGEPSSSPVERHTPFDTLNLATPSIISMLTELVVPLLLVLGIVRAFRGETRRQRRNDRDATQAVGATSPTKSAS